MSPVIHEPYRHEMLVLVIRCGVTNHVHHLMQSSPKTENRTTTQDDFVLLLCNKEPPATVLYPALSQGPHTDSCGLGTSARAFQQRPVSKLQTPAGFLLSSKRLSGADTKETLHKDCCFVP